LTSKTPSIVQPVSKPWTQRHLAWVKQAVYFEQPAQEFTLLDTYGGQSTSFRVPHALVMRVVPYIDGVGVFTNHGQSQVFVTTNGDYGWFLYNLVRHLSSDNPVPPSPAR